MKLFFLTLFIIGCFVAGVSAQEPPQEEHISVEQIDAYIEAIQQKMEDVKSDPDSHKEALEQGWYHEMNLNIKAAKRRRRLLLGESEPKTAPTSSPNENRQLPKNTNY